MPLSKRDKVAYATKVRQPQPRLAAAVNRREAQASDWHGSAFWVPLPRLQSIERRSTDTSMPQVTGSPPPETAQRARSAVEGAVPPALDWSPPTPRLAVCAALVTRLGRFLCSLACSGPGARAVTVSARFGSIGGAPFRSRLSQWGSRRRGSSLEAPAKLLEIATTPWRARMRSRLCVSGHVTKRPSRVRLPRAAIRFSHRSDSPKRGPRRTAVWVGLSDQIVDELL